MRLSNRFLPRSAAAFAAAMLCGFSGGAQAQTAAPAAQCAPSAARLEALRAAQSGVFRALRVNEDAAYLGDLPFQNASGQAVRLADFSGKMLLVNLWGVWCPPCRAEIPDLAALQSAQGSADFAVLTIYDQASSRDKVEAFLKQHQAENLPLYHDPNMDFYGALKRMGLARGLPVSLLVDAKSCLIASLNGGVNWNSAEALAFIKAAQRP